MWIKELNIARSNWKISQVVVAVAAAVVIVVVVVVQTDPTPATLEATRPIVTTAQ